MDEGPKRKNSFSFQHPTDSQTYREKSSADIIADRCMLLLSEGM